MATCGCVHLPATQFSLQCALRAEDRAGCGVAGGLPARGRSPQSEMEPLPSGCCEDDHSIYSVDIDENSLAPLEALGSGVWV